MFEDFDHSLFDDPEFKEDSVREEIVVPIVKRLGYEISGPNRIVRSRSLLHPYVMIGSKKHPVHIIPDYLLYSKNKPGLVLDAKHPLTSLVKSKHAEQAYSYAIHPDVRVRFYALCNGRSLVAYDIYGLEPVFDIDLKDLDRDWNIINSVLSPGNTAVGPLRELQPDLGVFLAKMGYNAGDDWPFPCNSLSFFGRLNEGEYLSLIHI